MAKVNTACSGSAGAPRIANVGSTHFGSTLNPMCSVGASFSANLVRLRALFQACQSMHDEVHHRLRVAKKNTLPCIPQAPPCVLVAIEPQTRPFWLSRRLAERPGDAQAALRETRSRRQPTGATRHQREHETVTHHRSFAAGQPKGKACPPSRPRPTSSMSPSP